MSHIRLICAAAGLVLAGATSVHAQNLLTNGNLDLLQSVEIVPGFFLPKPASWQNEGSRAITGPYEDEMSSETWAGPAPTPVTTDGLANPLSFANPAQPDWAVFFKAFSTSPTTNGPMTGHLFQDVPATPGANYSLTAWAGSESNLLASDVELALEFLNGGGGIIGGSVLSLLPTLFINNAEPFNYKQYALNGVAPAGTVSVRARASIIGGLPNPLGGGQALVFDDFVLVPAPGAAAGLALAALMAARRRR